MKLLPLPYGLIFFVAIAMAPTSARAEVIYPKPPQEYDVSLRFQIRAPLPAWFDRFDEMIASLKSFGLVREPLPVGEPEDPSNDRLKGVISSDNARNLIRHPFVHTILLTPHNAKLAATDRVRIRLELVPGLGLSQQQKLSRQVVQKIAPLGFVEAPGYDHRGFMWLVGTIEAGQLPKLLNDARSLPAGWLVPTDPVSTLEPPLRNQTPVRVIEVFPEPGDVPPAQAPPTAPTFAEDKQHLAKIAHDLRPLIAKDGDDTKYLRLEVIMADSPAESDFNWERMLRSTASTVVVEGRMGSIATVTVRATQAEELARPAGVIAVRLPRSGEAQPRPGHAAAVNALAQTRLDQYHERGRRGRGVKVAVVSGDFGGWERINGAQLVDFTAPRNRSLEPDPMPSQDGAIGRGTLSALAVRMAAPEADLVLVRVDPTAAHQLLLLAEIINEAGVEPRILQERYNEITRDRTANDLKRAELIEQRRRALAEQIFEEGDSKKNEKGEEIGEQRLKYLASQARIQKVEEDLKLLQTKEAEVRRRTQLYQERKADVLLLVNTRVVVNTLTWNDGFPLDGASALSRYLDETPFTGYRGLATPSKISAGHNGRGTIWVQAGGDSRGQTWTGLFRDEDANGAMEFTSATSLPRGRWTHEMNFLAWQDFTGQTSADLPEKVRLRVTVQWREPHDPILYRSTDDPYRSPIANIGVMVLKQRDPNGLRLASDDMELIARSYGTPVRLHLGPTNGTYEATAEFDAPAGGRFAVRLDGTLPATIRPAGDFAGGAAGLTPEIRPRVYVEVVDAASRAKGRAVFADYANQATDESAGVGMPGDAANVVTVGAADDDGKPRPYSALGAGPLRELMSKPDLLGFDNLELAGQRVAGSWVAASFNGGFIACMIGANAPARPRHLLRQLDLPPNSVLAIPKSWLK